MADYVQKPLAERFEEWLAELNDRQRFAFYPARALPEAYVKNARRITFMTGYWKVSEPAAIEAQVLEMLPRYHRDLSLPDEYNGAYIEAYHRALMRMHLVKVLRRCASDMSRETYLDLIRHDEYLVARESVGTHSFIRWRRHSRRKAAKLSDDGRIVLAARQAEFLEAPIGALIRTMESIEYSAVNYNITDFPDRDGLHEDLLFARLVQDEIVRRGQDTVDPLLDLFRRHHPQYAARERAFGVHAVQEMYHQHLLDSTMSALARIHGVPALPQPVRDMLYKLRPGAEPAEVNLFALTLTQLSATWQELGKRYAVSTVPSGH